MTDTAFDVLDGAVVAVSRDPDQRITLHSVKVRRFQDQCWVHVRCADGRSGWLRIGWDRVRQLRDGLTAVIGD